MSSPVSRLLKSGFAFASACSLSLLFIRWAWAAKEEVVTHPDGTVEKTTTYYPPLAEYIVIALAIMVGALIASWGVKIIIAGMDYGHDGAPTNLELDLKQRRLRLKKLTQGSLISLFGSFIILGSLYLMTS